MKRQIRDHRRDVEILHMRDNMKMTYPQIAEKYNVTKARIRQLYERIKQERVNKEMGIGA